MSEFYNQLNYNGATFNTMEQEWKHNSNVNKLQRKGIKVTIQYWKERDTRQHLEKVVESLRQQLNESFNCVEHNEYCKDKLTDELNITKNCFINASNTIMALSSKSNMKPLNNEMAQVFQILNNIHATYKQDLNKMERHYERIRQNIKRTILEKPKIMESKITGLNIFNERLSNMQRVTSESLNDLVDSIVQLSKKPNGEFKNNEMQQIAQLAMNAKKENSTKLNLVAINHCSNLIKLYDENCDKK